MNTAAHMNRTASWLDILCLSVSVYVRGVFTVGRGQDYAAQKVTVTCTSANQLSCVFIVYKDQLQLFSGAGCQVQGCCCWLGLAGALLLDVAVAADETGACCYIGRAGVLGLAGAAAIEHAYWCAVTRRGVQAGCYWIGPVCVLLLNGVMTGALQLLSQ